MRLIDADVLAEIFIDRMEKVTERFGFNSSEAGILAGAYKLLQSQPTIEPEQRWIPCSERLPEEEDSIFAKFYGTDRWRETMMRKRSDRVIVTAEYQNGNRITDVAGTCDGKWVNDISAMDRKIVAWQPLPEPYREENKHEID